MTKVFRSADFWSGMALATLGVWIVVRAWQWEYLGPDGPGAGFFPLWYGIAIFAFSLALAASSVTRNIAEAVQMDWAAIRRALIAWAALAVAVVSFWVIGFVPGFALLCFFMAAGLYSRPIWSAVCMAVLAAAGFYLVFPLSLGVSLPTGLWGF